MCVCKHIYMLSPCNKEEIIYLSVLILQIFPKSFHVGIKSVIMGRNASPKLLSYCLVFFPIRKYTVSWIIQL